MRKTVEETLNALLDEEAAELAQAARCERSEGRQAYRSGHYERALLTASGEATIKMPKLKGLTFQTAIIERCRRGEAGVEEAMVEMYLAGVSTRRVQDVTELLWGKGVSAGTVSNLNKKAYGRIEEWRSRPLGGKAYPYLYVDGIYFSRNWGGEFESVAVLVAIGVGEDGHREILGAAEGMKEDKAGWVEFLRGLKERGLRGVRLAAGDRRLGLVEAAREALPEAKIQRRAAHFYRNVSSKVPGGKMKAVANMVKAIHAQESKKAAREKAASVVKELRAMRLNEAAKTVENGMEETLACYDFPPEHWRYIRTNNVIERVNRELRRRCNVAGAFPDGHSALMLVCARLMHIASTDWGKRRNMNMERLNMVAEETQ